MQKETATYDKEIALFRILSGFYLGWTQSNGDAIAASALALLAWGFDKIVFYVKDSVLPSVSKKVADWVVGRKK